MQYGSDAAQADSGQVLAESLTQIFICERRIYTIKP